MTLFPSQAKAQALISHYQISPSCSKSYKTADQAAARALDRMTPRRLIPRNLVPEKHMRDLNHYITLRANIVDKLPLEEDTSCFREEPVTHSCPFLLMQVDLPLKTLRFQFDKEIYDCNMACKVCVRLPVIVKFLVGPLWVSLGLKPSDVLILLPREKRTANLNLLTFVRTHTHDTDSDEAGVRGRFRSAQPRKLFDDSSPSSFSKRRRFQRPSPHSLFASNSL